MEPILFQDLLDKTVAEATDKLTHSNILSIAGIDHQENAWSNIYAYFLDEHESHGLKLLFKNSLEQIIYRKTGRTFNLAGGIIRREYSTIAGNRIDVLVEGSEYTVIIENKVHHHLNNDLDDYWLSSKGSDDVKIGIVLTLTHILTNNSNYINITHLEWIDEVEKQLSLNRAFIKPQTTVLLNDFLDNVKQATGKMNESELTLYLKEREKFNNLYTIAAQSRKWFQSIFTDSAFIRSLGNYTLVHTDRTNSAYRYAMYRFPDTDEFVVTVFYEFLWNSKPGNAQLCLFLEPLGIWLDNAITNEAVIRSIARDEGVPSMKRHKDFWHCASVEIAVPEDELPNELALKAYIENYLANPDSKLLKAADRIIQVLSEKPKPTYLWDDVLRKIKELSPEKDTWAWWDMIDFYSFDIKQNVVIMEVPDNFFRYKLEHEHHDILMRAIHCVYGENVDCRIMCRNLYG